MSATERVRELVEPIIVRGGAEVYDIEYRSGILRITVDREGGIDIDTVGELTQEISAALDHSDPLPGQRYLLEVSSPGIERKLRLPDHFCKQIGEDISVKVRSNVEGPRRFEARLDAVDDNGIEVTVTGTEGIESRRIAFDEIESARKLFHWGETKPGNAGNTKGAGRPPRTDNSITTKKKAAAR